MEVQDRFPALREAFRALCRALLYLIAFLSLRYLLILSCEWLLLATLPGSYSEAELPRALAAAYRQHYQVISLVLRAALLLLFSLWFLARGKNLAAETSLRPLNRFGAGVSAMLGFAACGTVLGLLNLLPLPASLTGVYQDTMATLTGGSLPLQFCNTLLLAPLLEEVIFRGLFFNRLRTALPFPVAALLSALAFAMLHNNLLQGIYAFVLGVALAALFERTGSIGAPLLCHFAFNATSYLWQLMPADCSRVLLILLTAGCALLTAAMLLPLISERLACRLRPSISEEETQDASL